MKFNSNWSNVSRKINVISQGGCYRERP